MTFAATVFCPFPLAILDMLGGSELLVIFLLVLIFFGGEKMPQFAKGLGKAIREFRKAAAGVEEEFKKAMEEDPAPVKPVAAYTATPTILPPVAPTLPVGSEPASPAPTIPPADGDPYAVAKHGAGSDGAATPAASPPTGAPATEASRPAEPGSHVDAG